MVIRYTPTDAILVKTAEFAKAVVETTDYKDSNQFSKTKIMYDHFISKLGEEAVKYICELAGFEVSEPDYTIYKGNKKSWKPDLYIQNMGISVKTQSETSAESFGLSWMFQDSLQRSDPILHQPDALVFFVKCYDKSGSYICEMFPPKMIKELIFKEPKLARLRKFKRVVYAKDVYG
jgi:hypothetical protein